MRESELILRDDGSIYHLALHPGDLATTIVTVGDQGRVPEVSKHFDKIEVIKSSREFLTHTGYIGNKRISCVSTGMGSDNIDIFMNEVDALFNIDFDEKKVKEKPTSLTFIRIGTSGSIHPKIALGDLLVTEVAIGLEGLMLFYELGHPSQMEKAWLDELKTVHLPVRPEVFVGSDVLRN
ncbi:MAG: uridine phosphorylase, partial [Bacteroidia bacterium]